MNHVARIVVSLAVAVPLACQTSTTPASDGGLTAEVEVQEIEVFGAYDVVENWPSLPAGYLLGHPQEFPMPEARSEERAEREKARAETIARGEEPPPRAPSLQPGVSGVALGPDDHLYVFNRGEHPVIVLDAAGNFVRSGAEGITGTVPHFIKVESNGNVWLVDEAAHRVLKMNPAMDEVLLQIGVTDEAGYDPTHLDKPADVAVSSAGEIFIADGYGNNRIAKYSPDGEFLMEWGGGPEDESDEDGKFHLPHSVLLDSQDKIYVLDRENHRFQMFDTDGNFLGKWTHLGYAWGMTLSPDDSTMFVTEHESEQVLKVRVDDGEILARWGRQGRGAGEFDWAHGLVVDSAGSVYVGDTYGQRLQKFVPPSTSDTTSASRSEGMRAGR